MNRALQGRMARLEASRQPRAAIHVVELFKGEGFVEAWAAEHPDEPRPAKGVLVGIRRFGWATRAAAKSVARGIW